MRLLILQSIPEYLRLQLPWSRLSFMNLNQKTAVRIKEARELKNILQEQFAKAIAMS
jgi:hypothetical protein